MTGDRPTRWQNWMRSTAHAAVACLVLTGAGCRVLDRPGGIGGLVRGGGKGPDPLLGSRIPATDLPLPGRGEGYGKGGKDPLLGLPTRGGEPASGDLPRAGREPYRPGPESTAAGLAGRLPTQDIGLSIGERPDRRGPAATASGGPVPLRPTDHGSAGGMTYTQITDALRNFQARWSEPSRENGAFVFRADVPIEGGPDGAVRRYEGTGSTAAAAAKQVLDQIRGDRGLE